MTHLHNYNVPGRLLIPEGATHYESSLVNPFFKYVSENEIYQYIQYEWVKCVKHPRLGYQSIGDKISPLPNSNKRINTIFGEGNLLGKEMGRFIVDLDNNPFHYRPCYIYQADIV